jgi:hypothetical protein
MTSSSTCDRPRLRARTTAEAEALAAAGPDARVESGEAAFALGPSATVVIVDPGDRPNGNCVTSVDDVVLRGPFPVPVADRLSAGDLQDRPILGYVRTPEGCLPLGQMRIVLLHHEPYQIPGITKGILRECRLWLKDSLPFEVIDRIRPTPPEHLPDIRWLELLPHDPIGGLGAFVAGWYADVPASGEPVTAGLPAPLVEFYRIAAGRRQILACRTRSTRRTKSGRRVTPGWCGSAWRTKVSSSYSWTKPRSTRPCSATRCTAPRLWPNASR